MTNFYAIPCYTQAIQHLSAYPDIKQYSSAIDDIQRALLAAIHEERAGGGPNSSGGPSLGGGGGSAAAAVERRRLERRRLGRSPERRPQQLASDIGPGNAQSIPLPLLVLGGLALAPASDRRPDVVRARLQARRVTPAPAIAKRR